MLTRICTNMGRAQSHWASKCSARGDTTRTRLAACISWADGRKSQRRQVRQLQVAATEARDVRQGEMRVQQRPGKLNHDQLQK
jgi:hypothetical protein